MCTVTVIGIGDPRGQGSDGGDDGGFRLVHNRDEQRTRAPAEPPAWRDIRTTEGGPRRAVWPVDADAGGTWVAARDDGLVLAVMNVNPEPLPPMDRSTLRSRGELIPRLIEIDRLVDIEAAVLGLDAWAYPPFRLLGLARPTTGEPPEFHAWTWSRDQEGIVAESVVAPVCWPTSGLGDSVVAARRPLFQDLVGPDPTPANQDAFHRHAWPGRGAESVLMSRPDARTVSITTVLVSPDGPTMTYDPTPETA